MLTECFPLAICQEQLYIVLVLCFLRTLDKVNKLLLSSVRLHLLLMEIRVCQAWNKRFCLFAVTRRSRLACCNGDYFSLLVHGLFGEGYSEVHSGHIQEKAIEQLLYRLLYIAIQSLRLPQAIGNHKSHGCYASTNQPSIPSRHVHRLPCIDMYFTVSNQLFPNPNSR